MLSSCGEDETENALAESKHHSWMFTVRLISSSTLRRPYRSRIQEVGQWSKAGNGRIFHNFTSTVEKALPRPYFLWIAQCVSVMIGCHYRHTVLTSISLKGKLLQHNSCASTLTFLLFNFHSYSSCRDDPPLEKNLPSSSSL